MLDITEYLRKPTCWVVFLGCFTATTLLTPWVISFAHRLGGVEGGGYRKIHKSPTPLLGGLAISIPFVLVALACLSESTGMFRAATAGRAWDLIVLATGCVGITALGVVDDVRGMRARYKLLVQIVIATLVATSGYVIEGINIPLFGHVDLSGITGLGPLLTVFWIVGVTNALNIIDGMDGLATGVSLISAASLGVLAGLNGSHFVVLLCVALSGSLLAFLRYNWHPACIFLGDTGSMFLGFTLATLSLMGSYKAHGTVLMLAAVMALGIPIFETIISMVRRHAGGFPIFAADSRHTHHRLLRMGMSQRQVAAVLYASGLLCFGAAVLDAVLPKNAPESLIPSGIFVVTLGSIAVVAGYTTSIATKFRHRQETIRKLAFARYAAMTLVPGASHQTISHTMDLICKEFALNFLAAEFRGGRSRIASVSLPDNSNILSHPRAVERFFVKSSDGSPVEVVYQHGTEANSILRHTVAACLAQIFEGVCPELLRSIGTAAPDEELLPGITVHARKVEQLPPVRLEESKTVSPPKVVGGLNDVDNLKHTN